MRDESDNLPIEQCAGDVQHNLAVDVICVAVHTYSGAFSNDLNLVTKRHGEFVWIFWGSKWFGSGVLDDVVEFVGHEGMLLGLKPDVAPIAALGQGAGAHLDDKFSWVNVFRAVSIVLGKVVLNHRSIIADISKVDSLAALSKKEKSVELSKERCRWLMNGDEDCLADVGELAKETNSLEGGLPVKTRGWLVEEDKNGWLGDELNTDGEALALFDGETRSDTTDECVLNVVQLEKIDNCVDVSKLFLLRSVAGLSEKSAELKRFSDGTQWLVNIKLLTVTCRTLERDWKLAPINHDRSVDSTVSLTLGKDIEKSGLSSTRSSHKSA